MQQLKIKIFFCANCGKIVIPSRETQKAINLFNLTEQDIKIKCKGCKSKDYYMLVRFVEGVCHE
jgi:RNase P subunit RPR2